MADLRSYADRHGATLEDESRAETEVSKQLVQYLDGRRRDFDLRLRLLGTEFQCEAWDALCRIPFGQTRSYGEQAGSLGRPGAARAVGHANGQNPIAIIVPCHRVVGADGRLTGFGGGLEAKRWLLELERRGITPDWSPKPGPRRPGAPDQDQLGLFPT
ncbi:MAG: methylated-DNA--[protein]-cysteine S-methyltransferase [Deltaproteobacteria bacterium]|nr:methylated-DNA--[protein]-cysteine S-methyltransferase [Deltaproteobacteria bacterium]